MLYNDTYKAEYDINSFLRIVDNKRRLKRFIFVIKVRPIIKIMTY